MSHEGHEHESHTHARGRILFFAAMSAAVLVVLVIYGRAYETRQSDRKLCAKVDKIDLALLQIVRSLPDSPQVHQWEHLFRQAECNPDNFPPPPRP